MTTKIDIEFPDKQRGIDWHLTVAFTREPDSLVIDDVWVEGGVAWLAKRGMELDCWEHDKHAQWAMGNELLQRCRDEISDIVRQAIERDVADAPYDAAEAI
jgi:hypothetical protein